MTTVEFHMETSREFMLQAETELAAGRLVPASEKAWGAADHAMKTVAEQFGWAHGVHADVFKAIDNIVRLTGDEEIYSLFNSADNLYQNIFEGWLSAEHIALDIERVNILLTKLRAFTDAGNNGASD